MKEKFISHLLKNHLVKKGDKLLLGVSGGPDSACLLSLFNKIKHDWNLKLAVAHFNHSLRKNSNRDEVFVSKLASKYKLPFFSEKADSGIFKQKGSTEELARHARFDFLIKAADKFKCSKIVLGHNLDDQAETVLMRIIRGAGLSGISAILPKRIIKNREIIRPLLAFKRSEIERYLKKNKLKFIIDPTNRQDIYFRNKIRHNLMPVLENYNRSIKESLSNLAQTSSLDYDYIRECAQTIINKCSNRIEIAKLRRFHASLQRMIFRLFILKLTGDLRKITLKHINEIEDLTLNRPNGSIVHLPKHIYALKKSKFIYFLHS